MRAAVYRDKNPTIFRFVQMMYVIFAITAFFGFLGILERPEKLTTACGRGQEKGQGL